MHDQEAESNESEHSGYRLWDDAECGRGLVDDDDEEEDDEDHNDHDDEDEDLSRGLASDANEVAHGVIDSCVGGRRADAGAQVVDDAAEAVEAAAPRLAKAEDHSASDPATAAAGPATTTSELFLAATSGSEWSQGTFDAGEWTPGTFEADDDGFCDLPAEAFVGGGQRSGGEEGDGGWVADFGDAAPVPSNSGVAALTEEEVDIIRQTMAGVTITPPPWVIKMMHVQRVQHALQQASAALPPELQAEVAAAANVNTEQQWAQQLQDRTPGGGMLAPSTLLSSMPELAAPSPIALMPAAAAHGQPMGVLPIPRRRITGRQLVAERRKQREEARRASAAAAGKQQRAGAGRVQAAEA